MNRYNLKILIRLFIQCVSFLIFSSNVEAVDFKVVAEATPFTVKEDNALDGGEATLFVKGLLAKSQVSYSISFEPWKRAYLKAQVNPNILIYPIARDQIRETKFEWIGRLIPVSYYLFRLAGRKEINVENLEDAKTWRMGVVNEHIHHQYLKKAGFTHLQPVNSNQQNLYKLLLERIDIFPMSDGGMMQLCSLEKIECAKFVPILKLKEISGGLYLAASTSSDDELVIHLRKKYQELLATGYHQNLLRKRLLRIDEFKELWPVDSIPES
jgi:polar amino acid transport system substrate-binding protein